MKAEKIRAIARKHTDEYKHEVIGGDDYISVNAANNVAVKTANAVVEEQRAVTVKLYNALKKLERSMYISNGGFACEFGPFAHPNSVQGQGGTIEMMNDAIKAYEESEDVT